MNAMTRRELIPIADLAGYKAAGWREVFRMPGGWRIEGEAVVVVVEWRAVTDRSLGAS